MANTATDIEYLTHATDRKRLLDRLARVEGQLRGIQRMISEGDDCERVVQQMAAAKGGLHQAFCDLIACAFEAKLEEGEGASPVLHKSVSELSDLLKKYA